jgi:hypothetical protein
MRDLNKADFSKSEWRNVVAQSALMIAAGVDGETAVRWSTEEVYESRWAEKPAEVGVA